MEMRHLCLAFVLGVVVSAEQDFERDKSWEKRSVQENQPPKEQSGFWETSTDVEKSSGGQERVKEEKRLIDFSPYDTIQSILFNALKPKPIVDTADESELLAPNRGSAVQSLGELVVKGTESLSKALNSAVEAPKKTISLISSGATKALNQLGAYLIGL